MGTISKAGLKNIVACDSGTLATTPVDPVAMGIRNAATMKRSHFKPIKDYLDRDFRNMMNFNIQAESMQASMFAIKKMIGWLNGNCDLQVVTVAQASGGAGDCYKFVDTAKPGLDFEVLFNSDKRTIKPTWEVALPWTAGQTLVDSADSATPATFTGITHPRGENAAYFRRPSFVAFEAPKTTSVLTRDELISRSYSIKTVNKKQEESNMSIVDYLLFEIELKFRNASVANQIVMLNKDQSPSLLIKELNEGAFYDAWDFNSGVLTLNDEFDDSDSERNLTVRLKSKVFVYDIAWQFGATYGGDAADTTGLKGGTMRIGY